MARNPANICAVGHTSSFPEQLSPQVKDAIQDHEREWVNLVRQVRGLTQDYHRLVRRGDLPSANRIRNDLAALGDTFLYAHKQWAKHGQWNHYYRALPGGVVHRSLACRSINIHTRLQCLPELVCQTVEAVAARNPVCRHCCTKHISIEARTKALQKYLLIA